MRANGLKGFRFSIVSILVIIGFGNCVFLPPELMPMVGVSALVAAAAAWPLARRNSGIAAAFAFWAVITVVRIADLFVSLYVH